jgi:hypothetical protein
MGFPENKKKHMTFLESFAQKSHMTRGKRRAVGRKNRERHDFFSIIALKKSYRYQKCSYA